VSSGVLQKLRESVRQHRYVMTLHAEEEMDDDGLSIFDIENAILEGQIFEKQRDEDRGEWKYLISGPTFDESLVIVVTRLRPSGKIVIITVFRE